MLLPLSFNEEGVYNLHCYSLNFCQNCNKVRTFYQMNTFEQHWKSNKNTCNDNNASLARIIILYLLKIAMISLIEN